MDQEREIIERCKELGIGQCGLGSIRNFINAAFYHVQLPGTLPADKHVAFNTAIRFATNRIACQGRDGASIWQSRVLSQNALELRERVLTPAEWVKDVTFEHQDPVLEVQTWIESNLGQVSVDDVVSELLQHPGVVVLKAEERAIPSKFRSRGTPAERYATAGIRVVEVESGTVEFFRQKFRPNSKPRRRKYQTALEPFEP